MRKYVVSFSEFSVNEAQTSPGGRGGKKPPMSDKPKIDISGEEHESLSSFARHLISTLGDYAFTRMPVEELRALVLKAYNAKRAELHVSDRWEKIFIDSVKNAKTRQKLTQFITEIFLSGSGNSYSQNRDTLGDRY